MKKTASFILYLFLGMSLMASVSSAEMNYSGQSSSDTMTTPTNKDSSWGDTGTGTANINGFKETMKNRLSAADNRIDALKKNADNMSGAERDKMDTAIAELKGKRTSVKSMLNNLKPTSTSESTKSVENAMDDLENSIRTATPSAVR